MNFVSFLNGFLLPAFIYYLRILPNSSGGGSLNKFKIPIEGNVYRIRNDVIEKNCLNEPNKIFQ